MKLISGLVVASIAVESAVALSSISATSAATRRHRPTFVAPPQHSPHKQQRQRRGQQLSQYNQLQRYIYCNSNTQLHAVKTIDGRKIDGDVKPMNNFLLVKKADAQDRTEGGILLTGKAKIQKTEGTVVSAGPGKTHQDSGIVVNMPVAPGEGVVYGKYDGTEIEIGGIKHTLIRDDDILVKFQGSELTLDAADVVFDNILVFVEKSEEATEGGILIAKSSKSESRPSTGEVVKVGPGRIASNGALMPMDVAPGDMVKFRDFAGNEVEIEGKEYSVVKMVDILAKFYLQK